MRDLNTLTETEITLAAAVFNHMTITGKNEYDITLLEALLLGVDPQQDDRTYEDDDDRTPVNSWKVTSDSDPDTWYEVTQHVDGSTSCTCKGFYYRNECKHINQRPISI